LKALYNKDVKSIIGLDTNKITLSESFNIKEVIKMKKYIFSFIIVVSLFSLSIVHASNVNLNKVTNQNITIKINSSDANLNLDSNVKVVNESLTETSNQLAVKKNFIKNYNIFIPIELDNIATLRTVDGHNRSENGINVSLYIDYATSSDNNQVKVNRIYGNFSYPDDLYYLTNRIVGCHSGVSSYGYVFNQEIDSDSFDFDLDWDYVDRLFGDLSPRAWIEAISHVYDMEGSHKIVIEFPFS
jgi:hypothetical protein